jgi:hypothetical protein
MDQEILPINDVMLSLRLTGAVFGSKKAVIV